MIKQHQRGAQRPVLLKLADGTAKPKNDRCIRKQYALSVTVGKWIKAVVLFFEVCILQSRFFNREILKLGSVK